MKISLPITKPNISLKPINKLRRSKLKRSTPRKVVALDIGTFALKLVEMQLSKQNKIKRVLYFPWEQIAPSRDAADLIQHPHFASQLNHILEANNIQCNDFYIAATSNRVVMRPFVLPPNIPDYEIKQLLSLQIEDQIPYSLNNVYYDYSIVKKNEHETVVHVYASDKLYIDSIIDIFNSLKKNLYCINVVPSILWSSVVNNYQLNLDINDLVVVINFGASISEVNIFRNNELLLLRTISIGGNDFTNAFSQDTECDLELAEHAKCQVGINMAVQMDSVFTLQNELFEQIWRSIQYVVARNRSFTLNRIFLSGGTSLLKGLKNKLRRYLDVQLHQSGKSNNFEVEVINPFLKANLGEDINIQCINDIASTFAIAVGLAYGGV